MSPPAAGCTSASVDIAPRAAMGAPFLVLGRHQQEFLAVADGFQRAEGQAELLHQHPLQRDGAALGEKLVGGGRADGVRMALDEEDGAATAAQDAVHGAGDLVHLAVFRARDFGRGEGEVDRLDVYRRRGAAKIRAALEFADRHPFLRAHAPGGRGVEAAQDHLFRRGLLGERPARKGRDGEGGGERGQKGAALHGVFLLIGRLLAGNCHP